MTENDSDPLDYATHDEEQIQSRLCLKFERWVIVVSVSNLRLIEIMDPLWRPERVPVVRLLMWNTAFLYIR